MDGESLCLLVREDLKKSVVNSEMRLFLCAATTSIANSLRSLLLLLSLSRVEFCFRDKYIDTMSGGINRKQPIPN